MSTRSCIIIKVRPEDIGKMKKFNKDLLPVCEESWAVYNEDDKDKASKFKIIAPYLGIYCHFDGYPDGVGAALKENFKTYEQTLNLIAGGGCSVIEMEYVKRYATRKGEEWEYLKPVQNKDIKEVLAHFDWSDYAYLYTDENGWRVNDFSMDGMDFKDF